MKNLIGKRGYLYTCKVLIALSMVVIAGCTQVPTKTKECPPAEVIIRGSVQSTGSDLVPSS